MDEFVSTDLHKANQRELSNGFALTTASIDTLNDGFKRKFSRYDST